MLPFYLQKCANLQHDELWENQGQKIDAQGQGVYKTAYSKGTGKWVAKPVYIKKSYKWVITMMKMCVLQKEEMIFPKKL
jgi:hypothetical protein